MADDQTTIPAIEPTAPSPHPETEDGDAPRSTGRGMLTLADMTRALALESANIAAATRALADAKATHDATARHAVNFSLEARQAVERDAASSLADAERNSARVAEAAERTVRAILAELPAGRMVVDPAVEAVAATRAVIMGHVIATVPLVQLAADLRGAIQAGDTASMYVMANFLPARLAAEPAPNEAARPEIGQARGEIAGLLSRVRDDLRDTSADLIRKLAADVRDKAATARRAAQVRQQQAALDADIKSGRRVAWPSQPDLRAS